MIRKKKKAHATQQEISTQKAKRKTLRDQLASNTNKEKVNTSVNNMQQHIMNSHVTYATNPVRLCQIENVTVSVKKEKKKEIK